MRRLTRSDRLTVVFSVVGIAIIVAGKHVLRSSSLEMTVDAVVVVAVLVAAAYSRRRRE